MRAPIRIASRALARMGKRAAAYATEHSIHVRGGAILVPDHYETTRSVQRTLTRIYGRPRTIDRGEVAYWEIGGGDVEEDS